MQVYESSYIPATKETDHYSSTNKSYHMIKRGWFPQIFEMLSDQGKTSLHTFYTHATYHLIKKTSSMKMFNGEWYMNIIWKIKQVIQLKKLSNMLLTQNLLMLYHCHRQCMQNLKKMAD